MYPKVRFRGFDASQEFKNCLLSEVARNLDNKRIPITANKRKKGKIPYFGSNGIQDYVKGYTHNGTFILIAEDGANNLKHYPVIKATGKIWVNNHAHVLQALDKKIDFNYLYFLLFKYNFEKYLVGSGRYKLNAAVLEKLPIKICNSKNEQIAIGKILASIDNLLSLQQRKLELENELNRFYIGKIFANNNNYPELRFSSFNNSWEIAKLKEIITHKSGSPIEKYFSENGPLKVISIGSYGLDNSYIDQKIRAERNNVTEKYMVQKNDLTMVLNDKTSDCRILGRVLIINNDNEYVANQRTEIITPNKTVYPQFLYQLINGAFRTKIKKIAQGGTQIYVNFKSVEKLKLSIPEYEEQKDISKFLGLIKNKLSFEQSNVTITQQLKQFLLQNLFI
ncbi:restriction endonuclease subunit S [Lactobacillus mulieris]|uniref:restriction endonuclease subunit S n=1 Tax=Lactobacillus mulieris TaxID=2508708 RepID=UPI0022AC7602|nr:restriction endonuclease subunit S [Lactobacillus mulieris]MCZ3690054.1 restriction endonuclease subunit S [Lactobacillus mulieris]MCZ3695992.1 restriction endonuclease subunit S [Lactobacillus mulieris]MCZ3702159.1 restriction endonuclease subunit S [Lactobacillus mulieris]MCZ9647650.1 restriction endonuclease subunit S [Lactobacillus mulieris]